MLDRHVISLSTTSVISKVAFKAGSSKQGKVYSKLLACDTLVPMISIGTIYTHLSRKSRLHLRICAVLLCAVIGNISGPEESFLKKRLGFFQDL
jgi:sulfite exporter TauE/SafE